MAKPLNFASLDKGKGSPYQVEKKRQGKIKTGLMTITFFFFVFLPFLGPLTRHMGGSQARGLIRDIAAGLRQSHSNAGSEPHLQPTPQLTATPDR